MGEGPGRGGARAEVQETEEEREGGRRSNLKDLSVKRRKDACEMGRTKGGVVRLRWSRAGAPLPRSTMTTGQKCGHRRAKRQHEMPERFNPLHATNVEVTAKCDDDGDESSSHDSEPVVSRRETDFQALRSYLGVAADDF